MHTNLQDGDVFSQSSCCPDAIISNTFSLSPIWLHGVVIFSGAFWQGAPETIQERLANVPSDYVDTYKQYTRQGSRVLALAYKSLPDMPVSFSTECIIRQQT